MPGRQAACSSMRPAQRSRIPRRPATRSAPAGGMAVEMGADRPGAVRIGAAQAKSMRRSTSARPVARRGRPPTASARRMKEPSGLGRAARYGPCRDGCGSRRRPARRCAPQGRAHRRAGCRGRSGQALQSCRRPPEYRPLQNRLHPTPAFCLRSLSSTRRARAHPPACRAHSPV
jgi:hypothetical protein